jgi:hypothetical protein
MLDLYVDCKWMNSALSFSRSIDCLNFCGQHSGLSLLFIGWILSFGVTLRAVFSWMWYICI